ncbi:MAG: hypothetical protein ACRDF4_04580 [Rhabdochlamydiaceae bacterium]
MRLQGVKISHVGVMKWIRKYVSLMDNYLQQIQPKVGDIWRADELFLKVKGDMKYLFALMYDETRFWIAQQIADHKAPWILDPYSKKELSTLERNLMF